MKFLYVLVFLFMLGACHDHNEIVVTPTSPEINIRKGEEKIEYDWYDNKEIRVTTESELKINTAPTITWFYLDSIYDLRNPIRSRCTDNNIRFLRIDNNEVEIWCAD